MSFASDDPPGSPLIPILKAALMFIHFSPEALSISPEFTLGHVPVRLR